MVITALTFKRYIILPNLATFFRQRRLTCHSGFSPFKFRRNGSYTSTGRNKGWLVQSRHYNITFHKGNQKFSTGGYLYSKNKWKSIGGLSPQRQPPHLNSSHPLSITALSTLYFRKLGRKRVNNLGRLLRYRFHKKSLFTKQTSIYLSKRHRHNHIINKFIIGRPQSIRTIYADINSLDLLTYFEQCPCISRKWVTSSRSKNRQRTRNPISYRHKNQKRNPRWNRCYTRSSPAGTRKYKNNL